MWIKGEGMTESLISEKASGVQKNRLLHFLPFLQTVTINRGKSSDCCCYVKAIVYVALIQSCCFLLPNTVQNWLWNVKELVSPVLLCRWIQGAADSVDYETWSADVASYPASYFTQLQYNTSLTKICIHPEELSYSAIMFLWTS